MYNKSGYTVYNIPPHKISALLDIFKYVQHEQACEEES